MSYANEGTGRGTSLFRLQDLPSWTSSLGVVLSHKIVEANTQGNVIERIRITRRGSVPQLIGAALCPMVTSGVIWQFQCHISHLLPTMDDEIAEAISRLLLVSGGSERGKSIFGYLSIQH